MVGNSCEVSNGYNRSELAGGLLFLPPQILLKPACLPLVRLVLLKSVHVVFLGLGLPRGVTAYRRSGKAWGFTRVTGSLKINF